VIWSLEQSSTVEPLGWAPSPVALTLYIETYKKRNGSYVNEEAKSIAVSLVKVFINSYNFAVYFHFDFYILLQYSNFSTVFYD